MEMKKVIDEVFLDIAKAAETWRAANTPAKIREKVQQLLDKKRDMIVLKLLGFDDRWGQGFRIDHCNGRAGESAAGDYLKGCVQVAVKEWLEKVELPELPESAIKSMKKTYRENLSRKIKYHLEEQVKEHATRVANGLIDECIDSSDAESHIAMMHKIEEANSK